MSVKNIRARYKHPNATAEKWTRINPVLLEGEVGYESDTGKSKVGDGTSTWNELKYTNAEFRSDPGAYNLNPTIGPSNVLRSNLGEPTLAEIALIEGSFTNKLAFYPYELVSFEASTDGGITWSPYPVSEDSWKWIVSERGSTNSIVLPITTQLRVTISADKYYFLNAIYMYLETMHSSMCLKVEKCQHSTGQWTDVVTRSTEAAGYPAHFWLQHETIKFSNEDYYDNVRITFIPVYDQEDSTDEYIIKDLRWFGGYPGSGKRSIFRWDQDKNIEFPADIEATTIYENGHHVYSKNNLPSLSDIGAASKKHYHTIEDITGLGTVVTKDVGTSVGNVVEVGTDGKINKKLTDGGQADTAYTLTVQDTRDENPTPAQIYQKQLEQIIKYEFKEATIVGLTKAIVGHQYVMMLTMVPWSDESGGWPIQIAYCQNGKVFRRLSNADGSAWLDWEEVSGSKSAMGQTWNAKDILGTETESTVDDTSESGYSVIIDTTDKSLDGSSKKLALSFGTYAAIFRVQTSSIAGDTDKVKLEISGVSSTIASRTVKLSDFSTTSEWEYFKIPFVTKSTTGREIYPKVTCLDPNESIKVDTVVVVPNAFI